jgi:hydrogenase nickel incorporation protein HypA/HybF
MHELSLAERISSVAIEAAIANGARRILSIRLRIGMLSCVEPESLRFAMTVLGRGTLAEGARLDFVRIPCRLRCNNCGVDTEREPLDPCPLCETQGGQILAGEEFFVEAIDVDDDDDAAQGPPALADAERTERKP